MINLYDKNLYEEKQQIEDIRKFPSIFLYIENPSKKVKLEAVKQCGYYISLIEYPSKEIQLAAIKQNPKLLEEIYLYIPNPCQEILDMLMIKDIIE